MITTLSILGTGRNFLTRLRAFVKDNILNGERLNIPKIENKSRMSTLTTSVLHSSEHSIQCNQSRKLYRGINIEKKRSKIVSN
jgi:hypothetical protein